MVAKQKRPIGGLQTPTVTLAEAGRGLKRPSKDLVQWIRLANIGLSDLDMRPFEDRFPGFAWGSDLSGLLSLFLQLPEPLRLELLEHINRPEAWELADFHVARDPKADREARRVTEAIIHYEAIRRASSALQQLVRAAKAIGKPGVKFTLAAAVTLEVDDRHRIQVRALEGFIRALEGVDIRYLRECALEKCHQIFFAGRSNQDACSLKHANTLRKQRERDNAQRRAKLKSRKAKGK